MLQASEHHTVIFQNVDSLEQAATTLEDMHYLSEGTLKHLTIMWNQRVNRAESSRSNKTDTTHFSAFIQALRPKLVHDAFTTSSVFLHPVFHSDDVTTFAQELSVPLAKVEVYAITGSLCAAGAHFAAGSLAGQ